MKRLKSNSRQASRELDFSPARREHPLAWVWEPLETMPGFELRSMFGVRTAYVDGNLMLGFAARQDPWRGLLVCTLQAHHASLIAEFPLLVPHPGLPKWLWLQENDDCFEQLAAAIVRLVLRRDPRIGITPKPKGREGGQKSGSSSTPLR